MLDSLIAFLEPLWRFLAVGLLGVFINFGVTWWLKDKKKLNPYLSNTGGFVVAMITNFLLNRAWTFQSSEGEMGPQAIKFLAVALVGVGLNHIVVQVAHEKVKINYWLAKIVAVGVVFAWNFIMHSLFTFAE